MSAGVFVTGGAGYIGSHTCVELLQAGHDVTVYDNFCNSQPESLERVQAITGKRLQVVRGDIRDRDALVAALRQCRATSVIHFAGLKAVGESVAMPLAYYDNNVVGTLRLLEAMGECGLRTLVFSSSATVYGEPQRLPLTEDHPLSATNPYGRSKLMVEDLLRDLHRSAPDWRISLLRYFNPVGAHESGHIGEDPQGMPNNLMPFVAQVAVGKRPSVQVFGNDYDTPDGTGVRDYIHVVDLALGHLRALERLATHEECRAINLGTGTGYSVLEMIEAFAQASGRAVPHQVVARRAGDVASCYADPRSAQELLGWRAERGLKAMCADAWRWQSSNPDGYRGASAS
jgi:UDP-glucose 4-epimerase